MTALHHRVFTERAQMASMRSPVHVNPGTPVKLVRRKSSPACYDHHVNEEHATTTTACFDATALRLGTGVHTATWRSSHAIGSHARQTAPV